MEVIVATQWEYCAIVSVTTGNDGWLVGNPNNKSSKSNNSSSIQKFTKINQRIKFKSNDPNLLSKEISELGFNGWELVSVDQGVKYFKRPKLNFPRK